MAYPSILSTLSNPQPTDRLNSPSHSSLHQAENAAITEIEIFVGTISSVPGTLIYDIRSSSSNGGGHVQTANKGGTGQTSFTKGDLLVATSSSVLTKFSASSVAGQVLTSDPSQAAGFYWAQGAASTKINAQMTNVSRAAGASSVFTTFYACSVLGSTLGTNNAIRYSLNFPTFNIAATSSSVIGRVLYGGNSVLTFNLNPNNTSVAGVMNLEGYIIGASSVNAQFAYVKGRLAKSNIFGVNAGFITQQVDIYGMGQSSVESSADQPLLVQIQVSGADNFTSILSGIGVTEKIQ